MCCLAKKPAEKACLYDIIWTNFVGWLCSVASHVCMHAMQQMVLYGEQFYWYVCVLYAGMGTGYQDIKKHCEQSSEENI